MSETEEHIPGAGNDPASPPAMPVLPDGIGLTYDEIATLLARKGQALPPDDPVMMLIPICNALLTRQQELVERHQKALALVMSEKTGGFVESVQRITDDLGQTLTASTVASLSAGLAAHSQELQQHRAHVFWLSAIAAVSALVNVAVFVGIFLLRS